MFRLTFTCDQPEWQARQLEARLAPQDRAVLALFELRPADVPVAKCPSPGWWGHLPRGVTLAYEWLPELISALEMARQQGHGVVLLGWKRELSIWRQEPTRLEAPLQNAVDPWWLPCVLPAGCVLRWQDPGHRGLPPLPLPEALLADALQSHHCVTYLQEPYLRQLPAAVPDGEGLIMWVAQRDQTVMEWRQALDWPHSLELELRRHSRWLAAWAAAERGRSEEALAWWKRGCCQLPAPPLRQWFDALRLFARSQEQQPSLLSVADLLAQPAWRQQGRDLLQQARGMGGERP